MVVKYHSGYAKTMYHMVQKQVCYRGHTEPPLTYKHQNKLEPFGQLIHTSQNAIEGLKVIGIKSKIWQRGKSVMNFMDHTDKCSVGLSIGYKKLVGAEVRSFCSWRMWHPRMKPEISHERPGHQTWRSKEDKVFWALRCLPSVQCISYNKS